MRAIAKLNQEESMTLVSYVHIRNNVHAICVNINMQLQYMGFYMQLLSIEESCLVHFLNESCTIS